MRPRQLPDHGWPLDRLLVGPGTLRTTRELIQRSRREGTGPLRAWDLALRSQVTAQGASNAAERLEEIGLIMIVRHAVPGRAKEFVLARAHPLVPPLEHLFDTERRLIRRSDRL